MALHKSLAIGDIHVPYQWSYADATARLAATGFVVGDVGRLARQLDNNTLWMLTDESPITWKFGGDGGVPAAHGSTHQNGGGDEVATATAAANAVPKANGSAKLDIGWIPTGATSSTVCVGDDARLSDNRTDSNAIHKSTSAEISALTEKIALVSTDVFVIEDSAASYAKKRVQVANLPGGIDTTAIHKATAAEISAMTEKTALVGADLLVIEDSAASYAKKKIQISNLPAPVFGINLQTATDAARTTTTSVTYGSKLTLTTGANTGTYLVSWCCVVDSNKKLGKVRLYNSTDAVVLSEQFTIPGLATEQLPCSGVAFITLAGAAKTINLEFAANIAGDEIGCQYAYMSIWRIS